jgi:hypothetical protein
MLPLDERGMRIDRPSGSYLPCCSAAWAEEKVGLYLPLAVFFV